MAKKITLGLKVNACPYCKHANKTKLRQHRANYCNSSFKPQSGHCANFEASKPKKGGS